LKPAFAGLSRVRSRQQFLDVDQDVPEEIRARLRVLWPLILDSIVEGMDPSIGLPSLGESPDPWDPVTDLAVDLKLESDRDWQSTGLAFRKGQSLTLTCSGRYAVHDRPSPWVSEPSGITIDYYRGRPLGEVIAMLVSTDGQFASRRIPVGTGCSITFPWDAELWLQINDSAASRAGNSGAAEVRIAP
jgi:hypothetical protein